MGQRKSPFYSDTQKPAQAECRYNQRNCIEAKTVDACESQRKWVRDHAAEISERIDASHRTRDPRLM